MEAPKQVPDSPDNVRTMLDDVVQNGNSYTITRMARPVAVLVPYKEFLELTGYIEVHGE